MYTPSKSIYQPKFPVCAIQKETVHKLQVVFSAFIVLPSSEETEPLATLPSKLSYPLVFVTSHISRDLFFYFQLVSSGCSTVTHSPVPATQQTLQKYMWSEYPSLKHAWFSLALFFFFTNMIFNNHPFTPTAPITCLSWVPFDSKSNNVKFGAEEMVMEILKHQ